MHTMVEQTRGKPSMSSLSSSYERINEISYYHFCLNHVYAYNRFEIREEKFLHSRHDGKVWDVCEGKIILGNIETASEMHVAPWIFSSTFIHFIHIHPLLSRGSVLVCCKSTLNGFERPNLKVDGLEGIG